MFKRCARAKYGRMREMWATALGNVVTFLDDANQNGRRLRDTHLPTRLPHYNDAHEVHVAAAIANAFARRGPSPSPLA